MSNQNAAVTVDGLLQSERRFSLAMQELGYGRFEDIRIQGGELILDPWPTTVRSVKFGNATANKPTSESCGFELKQRIVELFAHVRSIKSGTIRTLEVRGGLPFVMEIVGESHARVV